MRILKFAVLIFVYTLPQNITYGQNGIESIKMSFNTWSKQYENYLSDSGWYLMVRFHSKQMFPSGYSLHTSSKYLMDWGLQLNKGQYDAALIANSDGTGKLLGRYGTSALSIALSGKVRKFSEREIREIWENIGAKVITQRERRRKEAELWYKGIYYCQ